MVEEDPNDETYYEMGYRDNPIPVSDCQWCRKFDV